MNGDWINALVGGLLIGVAVSFMLFLNGRVTGISGIINGALSPAKGDFLWRVLFISGLLTGGVIMQKVNPQVFENTLNQNSWTFIIAGLLVGFGTIMGSGCTSGHGVCGISRMSTRSLMATVAFMFAGFAFVYLYKKIGLFL